MNRTLLLAALLPLSLAGCAIMRPTGPGAEVDSAQAAERLRGQARVLRYSGRYAEAMQRLDRALALRPDDADLREEGIQTRRSWQRQERELRDRLLVLEDNAAREQLPLLKRLVRANPRDHAAAAKAKRLSHRLDVAVAKLDTCARRNQKEHPDLARDCLHLSLALSPDEARRQWLARLSTPPRPARAGSAGGTPAGEADAHASRNAAAAADAEPSAAPPAAPDGQPPELIKARELMQAGNNFGAVRYLERLASRAVASEEANRLLREARSELARNTEKLLSAGDTLYQEGKVKEALALWQAALALDPFNVSARNKSERALKVLTNMEALGDKRVP